MLNSDVYTNADDAISKGLQFYNRTSTSAEFCLSARFRDFGDSVKETRDFITALAMASHGDTENKSFFPSIECIAAETGANNNTVVASRKRLVDSNCLQKDTIGSFCCKGWNSGKPLSLPCALVRQGLLAYLSIRAKRLLVRLIRDGQHAVAGIISDARELDREGEALERFRKGYVGSKLSSLRYIAPHMVTALAKDESAYKELKRARMIELPGKVFTGKVESGLMLVLRPPVPAPAFLKWLGGTYAGKVETYKATVKRKRENRSKMAKLIAELKAMQEE